METISDYEPSMLQTWERNGFLNVKIHYSDDPDKDPETELGKQWYKRFREGYPERDWNREMEIDFSTSSGLPVYCDTEKIILKSQSYKPSLPVIRGWDFGFINPCVVFLQVDRDPNKLPGTEIVHVLKSLTIQNVLIATFARDYVIPETDRLFPGAKIVDYGDPAGNQRSDKYPETSIEILRNFGIYVRTKIAMVDARIDLLQEIISQDRLQMDPDLCAQLHKDMCSGYVRDKMGRPFKDGLHDHFPDAFGYAIWNLFSMQKEESLKRPAQVRRHIFSDPKQRHVRPG